MFNKKRTFKSRGGANRVLTKVGKNTYQLTGKASYCRIGGNDKEGISFFDFEGGPFVSVGNDLILGNDNFGEIKSLKRVVGMSGIEIVVEKKK